MSDVIKFAHSSTTGFKNGSAITSVQKNGDYKSIEAEIQDLTITSGTIHDWYTDRFDDVRYYTGDSSS
jgi:hypothetical protein